MTDYRFHSGAKVVVTPKDFAAPYPEEYFRCARVVPLYALAVSGQHREHEVPSSPDSSPKPPSADDIAPTGPHLRIHRSP